MRLGQHFMIDKAVLKRVADSARIRSGETVLEVGPGKGALTKELVMRGASVIAIEKDEELFEGLKDRFPEQRLINADALKAEWPRFDKCVSNLPYLISKKFILKLLKHDFRLAALVLQNEFAEKLSAEPGSRKYGTASVCAQHCCEIELLDRIPKNAFKPQPKVESRIVRLRQKQRLGEGFLEFITRMFQKRNRKRGEKRLFQLTPEEFLTLYENNKV